jgi:ABC-2 type transport system ATP-binding protein
VRREGEAVIEIRGVRMEYASRTALRGIEAEIPQGTICGLIGPNGAGKTTLLRILATVLRPTAGTAIVAGHDIRADPLSVRRLIGFMPDDSATYSELRVDVFLEFFAHLYGLPRGEITRTIGDILALVDLVPLRHATIESLSLGTRQRLALARALLHRPKVLLLDEPVSGLDPRARVEMRALLRELGRMGRTVLISSHVLTDLVGLCDSYLVLEVGEVVFAGSPDELVRRAGAEPRIEIDIPGRAAEAIDFLGRHPAVRVARATETGCEIVLGDGVGAPETISRALHEAGFEIARFAPRVVDLGEAFLRLTKGTIS